MPILIQLLVVIQILSYPPPDELMQMDKIQPLLDCLSAEIPDDENWDAATEAQSRAADQLVKLARTDDTVIKRVIPLLKSRTRAARYLSASVLLRIGPKANSAIPTLLQRLEDTNEDEGIRSIAGNALGFMGAEVVPVIKKTLKASKDVYVRRHLVDTLVRTRDYGTGAIALLIDAFKDEDSEVRLIAVSSLEAFQEVSFPFLRDSIGDKDEMTKVYSACILGRFDKKNIALAVPILIRAIQNPDSQIRSSAGWAWRELADRHRNMGPTLTRAERDEAVKVLSKALSDSEIKPRIGAAFALASFGPSAKPATDSLIKALSDEHEYVRGYSAMALGRIPDAGDAAVVGLGWMLDDESMEVRYYAIHSLEQIGSAAKSALPMLRKALGRERTDAEFRAKLQQAIKRIEGK
jgi:HEAT repeat protein